LPPNFRRRQERATVQRGDLPVDPCPVPSGNLAKHTDQCVDFLPVILEAQAHPD
jgi:hypothetical protein